MDDLAYLAHLRAQGAELRALIDVADADIAVPACPGWTVQRLVDHLGRVHRSVINHLRAASTGSAATPAAAAPALPHAPTGPALGPWFAAGLDELLAVLGELHASLDPASAVDTWAGTQPPRFWPRRMALETAVHRWDLADALHHRGGAAPQPLEPALALDGVDELFEVFVTHRLDPGRAAALDGTSIHLHATDAGLPAGTGEWVVTGASGQIDWAHRHAKGDAALRAPASDLLLWVWGRRTSSDLDVLGDAAVADTWQAVLSF